MKHVVIIGGGISGLAAAHRVIEVAHESSQKVQLTLLEASARLGGIVQTCERDRFLLESGPDSFISEKPAALELVKRLDLESQLIETNHRFRRSFVVRNGRLLPVPAGFQLLAPSQLVPFLKSEIFSWSGKARMALELFLPRRSLNDVDDESLASFVRRRFGNEALERMAQPMVGGIYTANPETLSLRATMPRFLELEREHGSLIRALRKQDRSSSVENGLSRRGSSPTVREGADCGPSGARYSLFLSFDCGMQLLTDTLEKKISIDQSVSTRTNSPVEALSLQNENQTWVVRTQGETILADAICLALPAHASARLLGTVDQQLASELEEIEYASSATINLAYRREDIPHPLDGFGFVVPLVEKRTILACTFSSVKFSGRAPEGKALLRAFAGGALQPNVFALSDTEVLAAVRNDLRDLLGIEQPPLFAEISRWPNSMPQYYLGHLAKVARIEQRVAQLPNFTLAGNAYAGLGIPDCIRSGESAAAVIMEP